MGRTQTTIRLNESLVEELDNEADEQGVNRSQRIRQILRERHRVEELSEEVEALRSRLEKRESRVEELEEQLKRRSQLEEKVDTLAQQQQEPEPDAPFFIKWYQWYRDRGE